MAFNRHNRRSPLRPKCDPRDCGQSVGKAWAWRQTSHQVLDIYITSGLTVCSKVGPNESPITMGYNPDLSLCFTNAVPTKVMSLWQKSD